MYCLFGIMLLP